MDDKPIYKMIDLLNRCKCDQCQKEKQKCEDKLSTNQNIDQPPVKEDSMQGVNEVEYWRTKCHDYEWMFKEQRDIAKGYKEIIEELHAKIKRLSVEKAMQQQLLAKI